MRNVLLLFAVLAACALFAPSADAQQIMQAPLDAPSDAPLFAGGKDVFGRTPRCRACHAIVNALHMRLTPRLEELKRKEEKRKLGTGSAARKIEYGVYGDLIETQVGSVCSAGDLWRDRVVRKECEKIMNHEDEIVGIYNKWLKKGAPGKGEGGWNWNWEMCHRATEACPEELAMHELEEFDDDGAGEASERRYRSEQTPERGHETDGMLTVTAGSYYDVVVKDPAVNLLVYTAFPDPDGEHAEFHASIAPALAATQKLFDDAGLGDVFKIGMVNADNNDVPPPYGMVTKTPSVCLYPANNKGWPRYNTELNDGRLTPFDVLFFVGNTASETVAAKARELMKTTPDDVLRRKSWDHDEL